MVNDLSSEILKVQDFIEFLDDLLDYELLLLERPEEIEMLKTLREFLVTRLRKLLELEEVELSKQKQDQSEL